LVRANPDFPHPELVERRTIAMQRDHGCLLVQAALSA
jgi:hypothetical protein